MSVYHLHSVNVNDEKALPNLWHINGLSHLNIPNKQNVLWYYHSLSTKHTLPLENCYCVIFWKTRFQIKCSLPLKLFRYTSYRLTLVKAKKQQALPLLENVHFNGVNTVNTEASSPSHFITESGAKFLTSSDLVTSSSGPVINPNEIMTSQAITIRDPETGAIYVQTQLLQVGTDVTAICYNWK